MPFIVANYVYASSQGQRTHSARTKTSWLMGQDTASNVWTPGPLNLPALTTAPMSRRGRKTLNIALLLGTSKGSVSIRDLVLALRLSVDQVFTLVPRLTSYLGLVLALIQVLNLVLSLALTLVSELVLVPVTGSVDLALVLVFPLVLRMVMSLGLILDLNLVLILV